MPPNTVQKRTSDLVAAAIAAHAGGDVMQVAFGVALASTLIVDGDEEAKTALAWFLRRTAARLDGDATETATLQ